MDSPIVCFVSRPPSTAGACRTLLPTDEAVYRLPPPVRVTLERVLEAGEWYVDDTPIDRRCYEVTVEH